MAEPECTLGISVGPTLRDGYPHCSVAHTFLRLSTICILKKIYDKKASTNQRCVPCCIALPEIHLSLIKISINFEGKNFLQRRNFLKRKFCFFIFLKYDKQCKEVSKTQNEAIGTSFPPICFFLSRSVHSLSSAGLKLWQNFCCHMRGQFQKILRVIRR